LRLASVRRVPSGWSVGEGTQTQEEDDEGRETNSDIKRAGKKGTERKGKYDGQQGRMKKRGKNRHWTKGEKRGKNLGMRKKVNKNRYREQAGYRLNGQDSVPASNTTLHHCKQWLSTYVWVGTQNCVAGTYRWVAYVFKYGSFFNFKGTLIAL
jgi:hypothetical protein